MTGEPPRLTIVGLGPGAPGLRTIGAQQALDAAERIVLRTRIHPGIEDLRDDPRVSDCDDLYQSAEQFDQLYDAVAARVIEVACRSRRVVYAVPGHPRFAERTVPLVERAAVDAGIAFEVLDAVSFVDVAASAAGDDPVADGLLIVDAEQLASTLDAAPFAAGSLGIDPARPLLVAQLYNQELAAAAKLALSRVYPDAHDIIVIRAAGVPSQQTSEIVPLHALDRTSVDHLTSLFVPPQAPLDATRSADTLIRIVARLRAPGGCPWDRKQTHASLRDAILEEAYETVDAIDADDPASLAEELGDLLLLVAMHAQLAEEEGTFTIEDIYDGISRKLVRRHPHVFGEAIAADPEAVIVTWDGVKAAERAAAGLAPAPIDPFASLPRSMPVTRKAAAALAPRSELRPATGPSDGQEVLDAIRALLARGIDPESAIEAALKHDVHEQWREPVMTGGSASNPGEIAT